jgi:hypothetical protein
MIRKFSIVSGGLALIFGMVLFSAQAYAKQPKPFSIIGNGPSGGTTNITCTHAGDAVCPSFATNCWCNTATGTAKASIGGLGHATFSADTAIVTAPTTNNEVGNCNAAQGKVTITSGNLHNSLVLLYTGLACFIDNGAITEPVGITMSFVIDPVASTGKFAGANGTGSITGNEEPNTGNILGNVNGNILFP